MELFKQNQYNPIPVEIQVAVLWAMQNNFLDDVPVEKVKDFQDRLAEFLTDPEEPTCWRGSRKEKAISDELAGGAQGGGDRVQADLPSRPS